eukprot:898325-Pyramimonas_sp.AAC.1
MFIGKSVVGTKSTHPYLLQHLDGTFAFRIEVVDVKSKRPDMPKTVQITVSRPVLAIVLAAIPATGTSTSH